MGGGSAPKADPNIGIAALKSAEVGENLLSFMQDQAQITNEWADEDRSRWNQTFKPLQDEYIADAKTWDSPARRSQAAREAQSDTRLQARLAQGTNLRQQMAMGVNPNSGRARSLDRQAALDTGLAVAGAGNLARRRVEQEAESKMANAINMGSGLSVNPATSMGLSNGAMSAGASGAMSGYGRQGELLNAQHQQQMQAYEAKSSGMNGFFGALGSIAGMVGFPSSKDIKTDKKPLPEGSALGAVRKMPVEQWRYKPGVVDGGAQTHIGPYAQDFQKATGTGSGVDILPQDAIGVALGAIRDLDRKVDKMSDKKEAA